MRVLGSGAIRFVAFAMSACVHSHSEEVAQPPDVIIEQDIARVHAITAYHAIVRLSANFLTRHGPTSLLGTSEPDPNVYEDDVFLGPVAQLKAIPASDVASIRVYRAGQAMTRFGVGKMGGVIEVYTKH